MAVALCDVDGVGDGGGNHTCGTDQNFSGDSCSAEKCTPKTFANADADLNGVVGDVHGVTCADGREGGGIWTCGTDGTFSGVGDATNTAGGCLFLFKKY